MKAIVIGLLVSSVAFAGAVSAGAEIAGESTVRIDTREHHQKERIADGVASGELTKKEAQRLREGQRHVKALEAQAKVDGDITPAERARIEAAQDRQSARIHTQKHDAQDRK